VEVWRTAEAKVGRYVHQGDLQRCSHPPSAFFDESGKELGAIENQPVERGSAEHKASSDKRAVLLADLTLAETVDCQARIKPR
jgi:hypothetical protein